MPASLDDELARYGRAFTDGFHTERERPNRATGGTWTLRHVFRVAPVGTIRLPSGRLDAGDAFAALSMPLPRKLAAGVYEAEVSAYRVSKEGLGKQGPTTEAAAWLRLVVTRAPVVRLEPALPDGQALGIDAGAVAVFARELVEQRATTHSFPAGDMIAVPVVAARARRLSQGTIETNLSWAYPEEGQAELVAVFPSGGSASVYWGLDASGEVACLAIDMSGLPE